jgi:Tfp pilus assembly protein PilN
MIKINLAKMRRLDAADGGSKSARLGSAMDGDDVRALVLNVIAPLAVGIGLFFADLWYEQMRTDEFAAEIAAITQEKTQKELELKKLEGYEAQKLEIERTELVLKTKIDAIETLMQRRDYASRSLVSISRTMVEDIWLNKITLQGDTMSLSGVMLDVGLISPLMSRLEESNYFKDVLLKNSRLDADSIKNSFDLEAKRE